MHFQKQHIERSFSSTKKNQHTYFPQKPSSPRHQNVIVKSKVPKPVNYNKKKNRQLHPATGRNRHKLRTRHERATPGKIDHAGSIFPVCTHIGAHLTPGGVGGGGGHVAAWARGGGAGGENQVGKSRVGKARRENRVGSEKRRLSRPRLARRLTGVGVGACNRDG